MIRKTSDFQKSKCQLTKHNPRLENVGAMLMRFEF